MRSLFKKLISAVFATAGTGLISYYLYKYFSKLRITPDPNKKRSYYKCPQYEIRRSQSSLDNAKWEDVGRVKKLWVYPVKSCKGISYEEVSVDKFGPKHDCCRDRSFLIVDENGEMVTGRKISATVLISPEYDSIEKILTLKFPHLQNIKIYLSLVEIEGFVHKSKVWDEVVQGLDCGDEAADWLTLALGRPCRLLYHGNIPSQRSISDKCGKSHPLMNPDDISLYADLSSWMLMTEESLMDLQSRVKCDMYIENFRPSILVEGIEAYDEDVWTYIKIGEAIFRNISPCERCIFPTINFLSGKRHPKCEPLKTLRSYRCQEGSKDPLFGINLGVDRTASIKVGHVVSVLRN